MTEVYRDSFGYKREEETKNKKYSNTLHRQRAYYGIYLPNKEKFEFPFSYYEVHHQDGNKLNNQIINLEILTPQEHYKKHKFRRDYGVWEEDLNKMIYSYSKRHGIEKIKILNLWKNINKKLINHFKNTVGKELVEDKKLKDYDFKIILDDKIKEIAEMTWGRVKQKLKERGDWIKKYEKKKRVKNRFFGKTEEEANKLSLNNKNILNFPKLDKKLFESLKRKRLEIARKKKIPSYIIFDNKTLEELAKIKPQNKEEMIKIKGIGPIKIDYYGDIFLECIKSRL